jgi:FMN phosphatase YigB (HAD superfamily)
MTIICDFDNALFDTRRFLSQLAKEWGACGVSEAHFLRCYRAVRKKELYSPGRHIAALGPAAVKNRAALLARVRTLHNGARGFLFKDVIPCLTRWKRKGHRLVLLTYGDRAFQRAKLSNSGLLPFFQQVIVTSSPHKLAMVQRVVSRNRDVVIIDDNLEALRRLQRKVRGLRTIHIERYGPVRAGLAKEELCSVGNLFQADRCLPSNRTPRNRPKFRRVKVKPGRAAGSAGRAATERQGAASVVG